VNVLQNFNNIRGRQISRQNAVRKLISVPLVENLQLKHHRDQIAVENAVIDAKAESTRPDQAYGGNIVIEVAELDKRRHNTRNRVKNSSTVAFQDRAVRNAQARVRIGRSNCSATFTWVMRASDVQAIEDSPVWRIHVNQAVVRTVAIEEMRLIERTVSRVSPDFCSRSPFRRAIEKTASQNFKRALQKTDSSTRSNGRAFLECCVQNIESASGSVRYRATIL
jgi:hypothetical protein